MEEKPKKKKKWITPKLIILTRTTPEEAVLTQCKMKTQLGPRAYPNECHTPPSCSGIGQS